MGHPTELAFLARPVYGSGLSDSPRGESTEQFLRYDAGKQSRAHEAPLSCIVYWLHDETCLNVQEHGYVGISSQWWRRLAVHQRNKRFPANFEWTIIFTGTRAQCLALEHQLRPTSGIGWNRSQGGKPVVEFTEQVLAKMRKPKRSREQIEADRERSKKKNRPEWRAKIANSLMGKKRSEESRARQSASAKGKPKSPEWRARMSEMAKARGGFGPKKHSAETRAKLSEFRKGNQYAVGLKHSDEVKARISAAQMGNQNWKKRKPYNAATLANIEGDNHAD